MNRGAQKVKAWRRAQTPKVTQGEMRKRFGLTVVSWSRIEAGQHVPRPRVIKMLEDAGICSLQDWLSPPLSDSDAPAGRSNSEPQGASR